LSEAQNELRLSTIRLGLIRTIVLRGLCILLLRRIRLLVGIIVLLLRRIWRLTGVAARIGNRVAVPII